METFKEIEEFENLLDDFHKGVVKWPESKKNVLINFKDS